MSAGRVPLARRAERSVGSVKRREQSTRNVCFNYLGDRDRESLSLFCETELRAERSLPRIRRMTQVEKRWPESSYFLLSREEQRASGVSL